MAFTMSSQATAPRLAGARGAARRAARPCVAMSSATASEVPDMGKRTTMNLLLLGAIGLPGLPLAGGFAYFVRPFRPSCKAARPSHASAP